MDPKVVETNDEHQPLNAQEEVQFSDNDKSSVMGKVKAKAKKFKETFKKHGHQVLDHVHGSSINNQDQHSPDDHHNLDQDGEITDNRGVDEPHVDENEAVKSATPTSEQVDNLGKSGVNFGDTTVMREEPSHEARVVDGFPTTDSAKAKFVGEDKDNLERPTIMKAEDPHVPVSGSSPEAYTSPNYQTKVTDPIETGVGETDIKPVMSEESSHQPQAVGVSPTTEIGQNIVTDSAIASSVGEEKPEQVKGDFESQIGLKEDPRLPESKPEAYTPHNFQTKVADHTGAGIDEIDMKPVEESLSRMNVKDETKSNPEELPIFAETQYHDKSVPDLSNVSKPQNPSAETDPSLSEQTFNTTTTTVEEQPCQETVEKQANQNSNTEEISKDDLDNKEKPQEEPISEAAPNKIGTAAEYGKNNAYSLTEKLAPVYDKVSDVGSTVKSNCASTGSVGTETKNGVEEQDKKGVSVQDYLAEKLIKPSEEDKALSEIISGALNKRKDEPKKASEDDEDSSDVSKVGSDSIVDKETNVNTSPREGMVDKLKGVVGSWFSKAGENQSSQVARPEDSSNINKHTGEVEQVVSQAEGEKKL